MNDTTLRGTAKNHVDLGLRLRLVVILGDEVTSLELPAEGSVIVGRSESAHLRIVSPRISREHLRIHMGEVLEIEDLGSANGTVVHNRRLSPFSRVAIAPGEAIGLADNALCVIQPVASHNAQRARAHSATVSVPPPQAAGELVLPAHMLVIDEQMKRLLAMAARVASGSINVLILGETGSGKELVAETIHRSSPRRDKSFLSLNCAAFTASLLESELFGHERGAFTGAHKSKAGLLESAPGGTVFLDELGEMSAATQVKLLRALESREVLRIGGVKPRPIDVRFVAATNRDLAEEVAFGRFRKDLYFRLNAVTLHVPPLRERKGEIRALAEHFLELSTQLGTHKGARGPRPTLTREAIARLEAHPWPGNVRELRNVIERALLLSAGETRIDVEHLTLDSWPMTAAESHPESEPHGPHEPHGPREPREPRRPAAPDTDAGVDPAQPSSIKSELSAVEKQRILEALDRFAGNQTRAAEHLGMSRRTFIKRLDTYGLSRPRRKPE